MDNQGLRVRQRLYEAWQRDWNAAVALTPDLVIDMLIPVDRLDDAVARAEELARTSR